MSFSECFGGTGDRTIRFNPGTVDVDKIRAVHAFGTLDVTVPLIKDTERVNESIQITYL
jgi:HSP20 family molecular chaperone IbpA